MREIYNSSNDNDSLKQLLNMLQGKRQFRASEDVRNRAPGGSQGVFSFNGEAPQTIEDFNQNQDSQFQTLQNVNLSNPQQRIANTSPASVMDFLRYGRPKENFSRPEEPTLGGSLKSGLNFLKNFAGGSMNAITYPYRALNGIGKSSNRNLNKTDQGMVKGKTPDISNQQSVQSDPRMQILKELINNGSNVDQLIEAITKMNKR